MEWNHPKFLAFDDLEVQFLKINDLSDGGASLVFKLHRDDTSDEIFNAFRRRKQKRFKLAGVQIGDDELPVPQQEEKANNATTVSATGERPARSLANRAGAACGTAEFQGYLFDRFLPGPHPVNPVERRAAADEIIKLHCGIKSKTELNIPGPAAERWLLLYSDFKNEFAV